LTAVAGLFPGCVTALGLGRITRHGFDFGDVLLAGLTVMLTVRSDFGQVGVDVAAAEQ
jgi:hypothetical protein